MLNKCANPECKAEFRYLHEGKLFILERANISPAGRPHAASNAEFQSTDYYDYYWLCDACSRNMVVVSDRWVACRSIAA